jgi:glycosyltransferase involved in cell wall biosynthesis
MEDKGLALTSSAGSGSSNQLINQSGKYLRFKEWNQRALEPMAGLDTHLGRNLTRFQCLYYQCRLALHSRVGLYTKLGRTVYLLHATALVHSAEPELAFFFPDLSDKEWEEDIFPDAALPLAAFSIAQAAEDTTLRGRFEQLFDSADACAALIARSLQRSYQDKRTFNLDQATISKLKETHARSHPDLPVPINRLMYGLWRSRPDLQSIYPLDDISSQAAFVIWFIATAPLWYRLSHMRLDQLAIRSLNTIQHRDAALNKAPLSLFMELVACAIKHPAFPVVGSTEQSRSDLATWFYKHGMESFDCSPALLLPLWVAPRQQMLPDLVKITSSQPFLSKSLKQVRRALHYQMQDSFCAGARRRLRRRSPSVKPALCPLSRNGQMEGKRGVTVVGAVCGTSGIAQHARLVSLALRSSGFPIEAYDLSPSLLSHREGEDLSEISGVFAQRPHYAINLFAAPVPFFVGFHPGLVKKLGLLRRVNVLYGFWELAQFPAPFLEVANLFDEIWAPSSFIKRALEDGLGRQVVYMPPPVSIVQSDHYERATFGLPDKPFLFLFTLDASSTLARKNPLAAIRAFSQSFSKSDRNVGLVIKVKNHKADLIDSNRDIESELKALISADQRIILIEGELNRSDFCELMAVCDGYVSLHRSEGFGYGMAEAMMLGKPVIATNYSGNVDFTGPETAFPVGYRLVPVRPGEYYGCPDGQVWAEADIEQAASLMRTVATDAELRDKISLAGQQFVRSHYGLEACGRCYRLRLEALLEARNSPSSNVSKRKHNETNRRIRRESAPSF